jgi:glycosyltransferase involved in cell wall biosynthesis
MSRLSVVTAVRNGAATISHCLASVADQQPAVEHVIVDGGSMDGTVEILRTWTKSTLVWKSEPDLGISDAFNKGLARASGDAILILGADDRLVPGAAEHLLKALAAAPDADFVFGHCVHREASDRMWCNHGDARYWERLRFYMPDVSHATMAIRRSAYDRVGGYDVRWRYAMDYDWLIRAERAGVRGILIDAVLAERDMGGVSDRYWIRSYAEARDIAIAHGAPRFWAWMDHLGRVAKGLIRRGMVTIGLNALTFTIRRWRQRQVLGR